MCFSATASFGAAIFLFGAGAYTLSMTRKKYLIPLAIVPLLFAVQQTIEGLVWLALSHQESELFLTLKRLYLLPQKFLIERLSFLFLIFAYVVWPSWIPFSLYSAEHNEKRATYLRYLLAFGSFISGYLLYTLLVWGATAEIINHHIHYSTQANTPWWGVIGYALTTIVPFFVSTVPYAKLFGSVLAISCIASYLLWHATFASVWCFFAAILSGVIMLMVKTIQKQK